MPSLIAKTPLHGHDPLTLGALTLAEAAPARLTSLSRIAGQDKALARGLKTLGLTFPEPNRWAAGKGGRIVWTGLDQAFLIDADPAGLTGAAMTDQTDGWAGLSLTGPGADQALMRLVPLDLRVARFATGHAARAPLNHMAAIVMRTGAEAFWLLVFRSMAETAWHEVATAMKGIAARARLLD